MRLLAILAGMGMAAAQAGNFLIVSFKGEEVPVALLKEIRPAGVILYPSNLRRDPQGVVARLRALDPKLLLLVDQEGGPFTSYREGVVRFPSAMALSASGDEGLVERVGWALGCQVRRLGADVNLAPVLDVNTNPDNPIIGLRSFGADPERVARMGLAFARGVLRSGAKPVGKHFPGHGDTGVDSHLDLPRVDKPKEALEGAELLPFRRYVAAGMPALMTAHILFPALDPKYPATLSAKILTGLLRREMGFTGAILTDDMAMGAIKRHYGAGEAAVLAVKAGADLLLLEPDEAAIREVHARLSQALGQEIPLSRAEEARRRAQGLKAGQGECPFTPKEEEALALEAARRGVVHRFGPLPIPGQGTLVLGLRISDRYGAEPTLADLAPQYLPGSRGLILSEDPTPVEIQKALAEARKAERLVASTYRWLGGFKEGQRTLVKELLALGKPLYLVALGNPDDLRFLPGKPTGYLATHGYRAVQVRAALEALAGVYAPTGQWVFGGEP
ncbi:MULTISPECIES: glycoside hydrolase family 3 protein [Thermus]|uniref:Beta-N-acetylglucosaminidase n=1 Tax=Thermus scotoductus (strain ATCC 700910 / SA-01) TaxID=743525 RepID=E8PPW8_THESS|nr:MULTISPECIES: glycoside hydrolase family 3 protein [Thermus]ADW21705.1 beta-N-acetylglucosaminidase [Thermus scotoductus SA-01]